MTAELERDNEAFVPSFDLDYKHFTLFCSKLNTRSAELNFSTRLRIIPVISFSLEYEVRQLLKCEL